GAPGQLVEPRTEQVEVTTELVDHDTRYQALVGGFEQREGAEHGSEDTAPVDVADDDHRQIGVASEPHVDVVTGPQVDLCRASGALGDDHVEASRKVVVRRVGGGGQVSPTGREVGGADLTGGASQQHHVAAPIGTRLEEHRVHRGLWRDPRRPGLDPL